jgi:hypothetical protein
VAFLSNSGCSVATDSRSQHSSGADQSEKSPVTPPQFDEDRTVLAVSKAIRLNHLSNLDDKCLAYQFDGDGVKDAFVVEVRESHRDPQCGGDPQVSPRLFTIRIVKSTGEMLTDAGSQSGQFRTLSRQRDPTH